jgi:hypothetical protein
MVGRISRLLSAKTLRDALEAGATDDAIFEIVTASDRAIVAKKPGGNP